METINFLVNWMLDLPLLILMITQNLMPMKNSILSLHFWEKVPLVLNKLDLISDQGTFPKKIHNLIAFQFLTNFPTWSEHFNFDIFDTKLSETIKVQKNHQSEMNSLLPFSDGDILCNRISFNQEINFSNLLKIVSLGSVLWCFYEISFNTIFRANWFDPQMLARQSPARMLRGGMMIPGVDPGPKWIDDTVHFFFQPAGAKSGIDLMSINIQSWILN